MGLSESGLFIALKADSALVSYVVALPPPDRRQVLIESYPAIHNDRASLKPSRSLLQDIHHVVWALRVLSAALKDFVRTGEAVSVDYHPQHDPLAVRSAITDTISGAVTGA